MEILAEDRTRAPGAADWALSRGRSAFTTTELADLMSVPPDQVRRRLHAPMRRGEWVSPAHGLWIAVPPEYRLWGGPPGIEYIDRLMQHFDTIYYVGWLTAAAHHGAAHQAPQVFQVAVARQVRDRDIGRTRFRFHIRAGLEGLPVIHRPTRSGTVRVSSIETTMLDVATDPLLSAGIDNAATVIIELAQNDDFALDEVIRLAAYYPASSVRRLGWILENLGSRRGLDPLHHMAVAGPRTPARLDPSISPIGPVNSRWGIVVNAEIEEES